MNIPLSLLIYNPIEAYTIILLCGIIRGSDIKIGRYKISNDKLFIDADGISYRVYPDYENICIIAVNKKTGEKKWYDGDSCWVDFVLDIL